MDKEELSLESIKALRPKVSSGNASQRNCVKLHSSDSLTFSVNTNIPNTFALTVPKAKIGYSRNPLGNFYTD